MYRVSYKAGYPKPKRVLFKGNFPTRRKALNWCRNHRYTYIDLIIHHPEQTEEKF